MEYFKANGNLDSTNKKKSSTGIFIVGCTGGAAIAISVLCYPFVTPALRKFCLPYVPATYQQVTNILLALKGKSGSLLDVGSGDGRIVFAAAKAGFKSDGVELNLWLVLYSRLEAFKLGLSKSTSFHRKDLWKFKLEPYRNVVIFGVEEMMYDLNKKFERELKDANVIACRFPLPSKKPIKIIGEGIDRVWVYHFDSR